MNGHAPLLRASALALVSACLLAACSKAAVAPPKPDPTVIGVSLAAETSLNVDGRGRATPVVVRTYVLKNAAAFEAADFFSLFDRDQQVLGDAVIAREEVVLKPGETRVLESREVDGGKVVAVLAAFREVDRAGWRATAPIVANRDNRIAVSLKDNRVTVTATLAPVAPPKKAN